MVGGISAFSSPGKLAPASAQSCWQRGHRQEQKGQQQVTAKPNASPLAAETNISN
jgi:hypothetical protein